MLCFEMFEFCGNIVANVSNEIINFVPFLAVFSSIVVVYAQLCNLSHAMGKMKMHGQYFSETQITQNSYATQLCHNLNGDKYNS